MCHNENGYAFSYNEETQLCKIVTDQKFQMANATTPSENSQTVYINHAGRLINHFNYYTFIKK